MKSMTGFGIANSRSHWAEIEVSVRSVNGRFLDPRVHLPREYALLEPQLKKILKSRVARGSLDISIIRHPGPSALQSEIHVQSELARQWLQTYRQLAKKLGLKSEPDLAQILRYPEILKIEERIHITPAERHQAMRTFNLALRGLERERLREGTALKNDLAKSLHELGMLTRRMESLRNSANRLLRRKMLQKFESLNFNTTVDSQRVAQEITLLLDRSDISEEIARLKEHISVFRQLFKSRIAVGKKLDFYTQELLREVNTIGSKAQLPQLTRIVVNAKTLIERIREQVQNIE